MTYRYALLDPRPTDEAAAHNEAIFASGPVYGVEVTIPALATRCAANLDPQHLGGDASTAAIRAAMSWPLPPDGATLPTIRADMDSIGAMAVLALRRSGVWAEHMEHWDTHAPAIRGVEAIEAADTEASGPWPGRRPNGTAEEMVGPLAGLAGMVQDRRLAMAERVAQMERWLLGESVSFTEYEAAALAEAGAALANLQIEDSEGVAVVTGAHRLAFGIGYRRSPVVVATNPAMRFGNGEPHLKHTVGRWNSGHPMDWDGMLAELRQREPGPMVMVPGIGPVVSNGWGGSSSICGSPQGVASILTTAEVADIVRRHLVPTEAPIEA